MPEILNSLRWWKTKEEVVYNLEESLVSACAPVLVIVITSEKV